MTKPLFPIKPNIPTLMFHDVMDKITPIEESRAIAQVWKSAQLIESEGLGHKGALQSDNIHDQVVWFLKNLRRIDEVKYARA